MDFFFFFFFQIALIPAGGSRQPPPHRCGLHPQVLLRGRSRSPAHPRPRSSAEAAPPSSRTHRGQRHPPPDPPPPLPRPAAPSGPPRLQRPPLGALPDEEGGGRTAVAPASSPSPSSSSSSSSQWRLQSPAAPGTSPRRPARSPALTDSAALRRRGRGLQQGWAVAASHLSLSATATAILPPLPRLGGLRLLPPGPGSYQTNGGAATRRFLPVAGTRPFLPTCSRRSAALEPSARQKAGAGPGVRRRVTTFLPGPARRCGGGVRLPPPSPLRGSARGGRRPP